MYAVIFKAEISQLDDEYTDMLATLRDLAFKKYGCLNLYSCTEGRQEITVSYWTSLEDIRAWKNDAQHKHAQQLGLTRWYDAYQVQVVEVLREYSHESEQ